MGEQEQVSREKAKTFLSHADDAMEERKFVEARIWIKRAGIPIPDEDEENIDLAKVISDGLTIIQQNDASQFKEAVFNPGFTKTVTHRDKTQSAFLSTLKQYDRCLYHKLAAQTGIPLDTLESFDETKLFPGVNFSNGEIVTLSTYAEVQNLNHKKPSANAITGLLFCQIDTSIVAVQLTFARNRKASRAKSAVSHALARSCQVELEMNDVQSGDNLGKYTMQIGIPLKDLPEIAEATHLKGDLLAEAPLFKRSDAPNEVGFNPSETFSFAPLAFATRLTAMSKKINCEETDSPASMIKSFSEFRPDVSNPCNDHYNIFPYGWYPMSESFEATLQGLEIEKDLEKLYTCGAVKLMIESASRSMDFAKFLYLYVDADAQGSGGGQG